MSDPYAVRKSMNNWSKSWAHRDSEPWTQDDDDFLLVEWIEVPPKGRDEVVISQILERTIESCRVRCEIIRKRLDIQVHHIGEAKEPKPYIGAFDEPEDVWWK